MLEKWLLALGVLFAFAAPVAASADEITRVTTIQWSQQSSMQSFAERVQQWSPAVQYADGSFAPGYAVDVQQVFQSFQQSGFYQRVDIEIRQ